MSGIEGGAEKPIERHVHRPRSRGRVACTLARIAAIFALLGFGAAARADSINIRNMPLAGDYGGRYGHTIVIDGKICRLGNSAGFSAPQGCNYEITAGADGDETLHAHTLNNGCSMDCEPAPVRRGDMYARHTPFFTTPRSGQPIAAPRYRRRAGAGIRSAPLRCSKESACRHRLNYNNDAITPKLNGLY